MHNFKFFFLPLILFGCTLSVQPAFSFQTDYIEHLKKRLENPLNDIDKAKILDSLAWEYRPVDSVESLRYANRLLDLAQRINYKEGIANGWNRKANIFELHNNINRAIHSYKKALLVDLKREDFYAIGRDYYQISNLYRSIDKLDSAFYYSKKSIDTWSDVNADENSKESLGDAYTNLGIIYRRQRKYDEAFKTFLESMSIHESQKNSIGISDIYSERALVYEELKIYDFALELHQKSLAIAETLNYSTGIARSYHNIGNIYLRRNEPDIAIEFFEKSRAKRNLITDLEGIHDLNYNIGLAYQQKKKFKEATENLQKSLTYRIEVKNESKIADSYLAIARVSYDQGNYQESLSQLKEGLAISKLPKLVPLRNTFLRDIAKVHTALGNTEKATSYYSMSAGLSDSLLISERKALSIEYSGQEMRMLEKDISLEKAKSQRNRIIYYSLLGTLGFMLAISIVTLIKNQHKQKATIAEQNAKISRKEIDDLMKTQELKLMNAMLEGQDEERFRLAADLHDRLGGMLSVVRLHFKSVEKNIQQMETRNQEQYSLASKLLNDACDTVRSISHDIGDSLLMNLGLIPAIEDLANTIERSKALVIHVVHYDMERRLPTKVELNAYKVIQELLSNILKHAEAQDVTINLVYSKEHLSITVEDDGKGFDQTSVDFKEGMGMLNIRTRVETLNGSVEIDSRLGHGSTTSLEIPSPEIENVTL